MRAIGPYGVKVIGGYQERLDDKIFESADGKTRLRFSRTERGQVMVALNGEWLWLDPESAYWLWRWLRPEKR